MLEHDIFERWLDTEAQRVLAKLENNEPLTQDDKLIIVIKGQTNHIRHLDVDLRQEISGLRQDIERRDISLRQDMERRFDEVYKRFEQSDRRFEDITKEIRQVYRSINAQTWKMIGAVGVIVLLGRFIERF